MVPFHSNPAPQNISWEIRYYYYISLKLYLLNPPLSGQGHLDEETNSIGRFQMEGWHEDVGLEILSIHKLH